MVVEKRYKQTDIGLLPIDWELLPIDKIFSFYSTSNYSKAQMKFEGEVGCIHYGLIHAISNSAYNIKKGIKYYVSEAQANYEFIKNGDVIMVDASEDLEGVNKSIEIEGIVEDKYIAGLHTFLLRDTDSKLSKGYRGAILNSTPIKNQLLRLAVGMKVFGVSKPQLKTVLIPIPPYPEQTAIATALSDMDELIAQTEKLIEKKKAIKQGVMQELLRPKEGWVTKKFTDVVDYIHGKAHEQSIVDGGKYKVVNSKFISTDGEIVKYSNSSFLTAEKNDILTVLSDLPNGKALAKCFLVDQDNLYAVNQRVCIWRSKGANSLFLLYLLNRHKYFLQLDDGVTQTHILNGDINRFEITITEDTVAQKEIGIIISDIDKEIIQLEKLFLKLKNQKQGMMHALLTGKIRLV